MKKNKQKFPMGFFIGLILALGVFIFITMLVSSLEPIKVKYYKATEDVGAGEVISKPKDSFTTVEVAEEYAIENGIRVDKNYSYVNEEGKEITVSAEELLTNAEVYYPIRKNDSEILNKLAIMVPEDEKNKSKLVPSDRRLVSISLDTLTSFGGAVKPGDRVDLTFLIPAEELPAEMVTVGAAKDLSLTALQGLKVFDVLYDVEESASVEEGGTVAPSGVSLLMTPEQVELFNLLGKTYTLSLNSASPVEFITEGTTLNDILSNRIKDVFYVEDSKTNESTKSNK